MIGCILVFGMPRSGTTWIGKLFDSHPDTLYRHEPDSVQCLTVPLYPETENAALYREELQRFVKSMPQMRSPKVVGKQPLFRKSYLSEASFDVYRVSVAIAKAASRIQRNVPCLYRPTAGAFERGRLVWKSIESPGRLGVCIEALPDVRAVHVMRHPCGYVASLLRGEAGGRMPSSAADRWHFKLLLSTATGKKKGLRLDDAMHLTREERLAWRWVLTHEKILADISRCDRVLTVRYEDVCADPLAMTQRMFEFTGLDWQSQTEGFVRASTQTTRRATDTDYYSVFKPPQASAGRWRTELAPEVIERVMGVVRSSPLHRFYPEGVEAPSTTAEVAT